MARQWIVTVDGNNLKKLSSGESVEIGRKPLRPLADDGFDRLDIMDSNKSMSKRHALFSVDDQGNGLVKDLHSTNGSFIVTDNGQLMRLPAGEDVTLPSLSVTLQFGDVRVSFEAEQAEQTEGQNEAAPETVPDTHDAVPNLFAYAVSDDAPQEPDAADMSVDDILNLRAGEPTAFFHARNVTDRADAMRQAEHRSFAPKHAAQSQSEDGFDSVRLVQNNTTAEDKPRDLFADAAAEAQAAAADDSSNEQELIADPVEPSAATEALSRTVAEHDTIPVDRLFSARPHTTDASPVGNDEHPIAREPVHGAPAQQPAAVEEPASEPDVVQQPFKPSQEPAHADQPEQVEQPVADDDRFRPQTSQPQTAPDETAAFTPIFEPGSVFDRVSKGGLAKQEQTIEVDGLTSDEAKRTDDFTVQFQMARHPELLPFLAMNPSLYDDLYAWLGALGNQDIDAALAHNSGYAEYRKAIGK